ncbi:MAG TPA: M1 family metallopeptidase [Gammaproteobacteria bacterium]|jgi:hypothetical protein
MKISSGKLVVVVLLVTACGATAWATRSFVRRASSRSSPKPVVSLTAPYDAAALFGADALSYPRTPERTGGGLPSQAYWQNRADYHLYARLDEVHGSLAGRAVISYTNNSPDRLPYLWLQLEQNIYRADSIGTLSAYNPGGKSMRITDGMVVTGVQLDTGHGTLPLSYSVNDTEMRVDLPVPLAPHGGKVKIIIDYNFALKEGGLWARDGGSPATQRYSVAQWYPRMVVYDDLRGWEILHFRGTGEFFLEYGDISYDLDVPWDYLVGGSGELLNPAEVLTSVERRRLAQALNSDRVVTISPVTEIGSDVRRPVRQGRLIWRFEIKNARDAVWGASARYVWDAVGVKLPGGGRTLAMAFYPGSARDWDKAAGYIRGILDYYSKTFSPYPYGTATAIAGPTIGMEYPACVFLDETWSGATLLSGLRHEFAHTWFPIMVGSDERRFTWMDEGLVTYMTHRYRAEKRDLTDPESLYGANKMADQMSKVTHPIMTKSDDLTSDENRSLEYDKAAYALSLLRDQVLGPKVFDRILNDYIRAWAYKHPSPYDFFRFFDNEAGQDLSWYWQEWFFENWQLDQAVTGFTYRDHNPAEGADISLENEAPMAMPAQIRIETCDGKKQDLRLPVEIWSYGPHWKLHADTTTAIKSVSIDPDRVLPDDNRNNNTLTRPCK